VIFLAVLVKLAVPSLPPFLTLFPAVLLCALLGGKWVGRLGLVVCIVAGSLFAHSQSAPVGEEWKLVSVLGFSIAATLIVFVVELLDTAIRRLRLERQKLDTVLEAAGAATWEIYPNRKIYWDPNFYRLVGLNASDTPPSTERFLLMVHPDDRAAMEEARDLMNRGAEPRRMDEYRLIKPDGSIVWLENTRVRGDSGDFYYIGITQDVTRRKRDEEKIQFLLKELTHRVKNQLTIVGRIATETRNQTATPEEFAELFAARLQSLAKSQDLLVKGGEAGVNLHDLLLSQLEGFASAHRVHISGSPVNISASATQYLAMAFYELATNAVKHGALGTDSGYVEVAWSMDNASEEFVLSWQEHDGPKPSGNPTPGFGSTVLLRLAPAAVGGNSVLEIEAQGLRWQLTAPIINVVSNSRSTASRRTGYDVS
jgi:PAS domain S-box-containing protein